jgi:hypothetical protein
VIEVQNVVEQLQEQRGHLESDLRTVNEAMRVLKALAKSNGRSNGRGHLSAAGRTRIAAAQRKRWRKARRTKS